jgi:cytosine/adenosine deaminase-related metal-dependent hydrolase
MPNISLFLDRGMKPVLGTDSLASVSTLNLFDEMAFMAENYADLSPQSILAMACTNGAEVMGRPDLGSIRPDNRARLLYVDLTADTPEHGASALVSNQGQRVEWI